MMIATFRKAPVEVLDFDGDWSFILDDDETILTSAWAVTGTGLTIQSSERDGALTKVWLSGGTHGLTYVVTNTITTSAGRTLQGAFRIEVRMAA